ncbi:MAG: DUF4124 domain-containing protein [Gammaproteobacteria bacterium]|nr:DUF4124 domain-containing protein [Gammaproteobacteria bacterium]
MKFKIFSMLVILGFISVMPMIYMGKFNPVEFFDSGLKDGISGFNKLKSKAPNSLANVVGDEKVQIYKWRDQYGVMQFSNTPPLTGGGAEKVELNTNENVVQAVKVLEKKAPEEMAKNETPNPYSIKGTKKVLQDAKNVEAMLQKRHDNQMKLLEGM